jgi:hypothetical protein
MAQAKKNQRQYANNNLFRRAVELHVHAVRTERPPIDSLAVTLSCNDFRC